MRCRWTAQNLTDERYLPGRCDLESPRQRTGRALSRPAMRGKIDSGPRAERLIASNSLAFSLAPKKRGIRRVDEARRLS